VPELWVPDSRPIQHIAELIEIVNAYINEDHPPDIMRF
jgi:hypothetical protein